MFASYKQSQHREQSMQSGTHPKLENFRDSLNDQFNIANSMASTTRNSKTPAILQDIQSGFDEYLSKSTSTPARLQQGLSFNGAQETPSSARTLGMTLNSSYMPGLSPRFDMQPDVQLGEARAKIRELKYELSSSKIEAERKILALETGANESEKKLKELILKNERLESNQRYLYEKEKEASLKVQRVEEEQAHVKQEADRVIRHLREENRNLKDRLAELEGTNRSRESEIDHKTQGLQMRVQNLEDMVEQLKGHSRQQSELALLRQNQLGIAEQKLLEAENEVRNMRNKYNDQDNVDIIRKQLHEQVNHIKTLEKSNRVIKEELKRYTEIHENVEILKEEKVIFVQKLDMMNSLRERLAELEVENALLRKEKVQWSTFLDQKDSVGFDSPYDLSRALALQRIEIAGLLERQGTLTAEITRRNVYIEESERQVKELEVKLAELEEKYRKELRSGKRLEKSKQLAQKEIGFLREQLKTYDTEETTFMQGNYDIQKSQRISQLEEMIDAYKEQLDEFQKMEEDKMAVDYTEFNKEVTSSLTAKNMQTHILEITQQKDELAELNNTLKMENQILKREIDSLEKQVSVLEDALGRGEYNTQTTKVLALQDNPASREFAIRESTLNGLRLENRALLEKIQQLQNGEASNVGHKRRALMPPGFDEDSVPKQSFINLEKDKEALEAQVSEKEKRMMRLKETFKAKAQEYREAVYSLLGYKMDFLENGRVRLTSMYSKADDHSFLFTSNPNDSGTMQLIGGGNTEYVKSLDDLIKLWVVEKGSIPGFLAQHTLELFERTQLVGEGSGWDRRDISITDSDQTWRSNSSV